MTQVATVALSQTKTTAGIFAVNQLRAKTRLHAPPIVRL